MLVLPFSSAADHPCSSAPALFLRFLISSVNALKTLAFFGRCPIGAKVDPFIGSISGVAL